jgi:hypothetical protein
LLAIVVCQLFSFRACNYMIFSERKLYYKKMQLCFLKKIFIHHYIPTLLLEFLLRNLLLFWWICLYIWLDTSLLWLSIFFPCFVYFMFREVHFWSSLFGVLKASCTWITIYFFKFRKFYIIILLNMLLLPLSCIFSLLSKPTIHRLGLLIVFQSFPMFYLYFLIVFLFNLNVFKPWYSVFTLIKSIDEDFN